MRYRPEDSFEQWSEKAREEELKNANKLLAKGTPIEEVLEILSQRLTKKILHPILKSVMNAPTNYDVKESKRRYEEIYLSKNKPVADHVERED